MSVQEMKTLEIGNEEYEVVDEKARPVKSVAEMKAMSNIVAGNIIKTIGYYSANDGGGATYLIREKLETDVEDLGAIHFINDNLVAEIIVNKIMNVKQFGAKGDGITDDTVAIQNAINNANHIVFPHGEYLVSIGEIQNSYGFYYALNIPSNKIVDFGTATIKCNPVNGDIKEKYTIIYLNECDNVKVSNGKIIGDLDNHIGTITEYGHAITTFRCTNSKIDNVTILKNTGDGICLQSEFSMSEDYICSSNNISIINCEIYNCRRQGISVIGADNTFIDNCYIHDIAGTSPQSCIDIEGNENERKEYPKNTIITNCRLINSGISERGLLIYDRSYDTHIFNCECSDIMLYGEAEIIGCITNSFHNYSETGVQINNSIIGTLYSTGAETTAVNCEIKTEIRIVAKSSREKCLLHFENCKINGLSNSSNAPIYDIDFKNCILNIDGFVTVSTVEKIEFYNCNINTKQRILAGDFLTLIIHNCSICVDGAVGTPIFYTSTVKKAEIVATSIFGNNENVTNGSLIGISGAIIDNLILIGLICNDRTVRTLGVATNVIAVNNYKTELNV